MALSPGPASTVLRFLRGGCGGDCLCGRLCEPCRGPRGPEFYEGTVARVAPEQVVLVDGRVFRRPGGAAPRPNQRVLIDDRPGLVVQTPMHSPSAPVGQGTSFVPLLASYDSPQRPGAWGAGFLPGVIAEPPRPPRQFNHVALGEAAPPPDPGTGFFPTMFQMPSGENVRLPADEPLRVRSGLGVLTPSIVRRTLYPAGFAYALDPYGPDGQGIYHPRGEIEATPEAISPFGPLEAIPVPEPGAVITLTRPAIRYTRKSDSDGHQVFLAWERIADRVIALETGEHYDAFDAIGARWEELTLVGTWPEARHVGPEVVIERRGPITRGTLRSVNAYDDGSYLGLQVYSEDRAISDGGTRYWTIAQQGFYTDENETEWFTGTVLQISAFGESYPWHHYSCFALNSMPREYQPAPALPWTDQTWRSAHTEAPVEWNATDGTLTAYGHTLRGGTWAGMADPARPGKAVVLHELEGTVTAVWPDGKQDTCSRAEFETHVLRCEPGAFRQFSPIGLGSNVWPPQWAWAVTGEDEARAVVVWDAWRDTTRREWSGRPRRPPERPAPPARIRPPLGLTLATTGRVPRYEEPLPAEEGVQQPPWHVPKAVDVLRGGQWTPDNKALTALTKPMLYLPAQQFDALNDRTSVRGPIRVTWAGDRLPDGGTRHEMRAALLLRIKTGPRPPTLTVNGAPVTLQALGRNAGERGWQPYLAALDAPYANVHAAPLTLTCSDPLSRLLLCRVGLGVQTGGGSE